MFRIFLALGLMFAWLPSQAANPFIPKPKPKPVPKKTAEKKEANKEAPKPAAPKGVLIGKINGIAVYRVRDGEYTYHKPAADRHGEEKTDSSGGES